MLKRVSLKLLRVGLLLLGFLESLIAACRESEESSLVSQVEDLLKALRRPRL